MASWTAEEGTLWALETGDGLPTMCRARVGGDFLEAGANDVDGLAAAMMLSATEPVRERLQSDRRCFMLKAEGEIVSYGWVTRGAEHVGELERHFSLRDDEAYIWDCGTVAPYRRQHCFSALLSHMIYQMHDEGVQRLWIGASRHNERSIRAFANAGFSRVVDVSYRRIFRLTLMWIHHALSSGQALVPAAYHVLLEPHERRIGRLAIGYMR